MKSATSHFYAIASFGSGPACVVQADSMEAALAIARRKVQAFGSSWAGTTRVCGPMTRAAARAWDVSMGPRGADAEIAVV